MQNISVVPNHHGHKIYRGDVKVVKNIDISATYKVGNTIIHIVGPQNLSEEETHKRQREFDSAGWIAWNALPVDERIKINQEYSKKQKSLLDTGF
jgi:hypothetical protein